MPDVTILGAGLAGSEAAWQAAERGCSVELWEMRPVKETPAHRTEHFAELVCSNSLGNRSLKTASGLLKEELRRLGSVILGCADANSVPAGGALGVAREDFPRAVTETVHSHPNIEVVRREATEIPDGPTVIATGPLTSDALAEEIEDLSGERLYFYDAASPDHPPRLAGRGGDLPRLPLRQGRGRLPELPDDRGAVLRLRRERGDRGAKPHKGLRGGPVLRGLPPRRDHSPPRRGDPALRPDEARGPSRPQHGRESPTPSCNCARTTRRAACTTSSASRRA